MVDEGSCEEIDLIVVGFDDKNRVVASPTSSLGSLQLSSVKGLEARYEDFNGVVWIGNVVEVASDAVIVEFEKVREGEWPTGLGLGSLIRVSRP
ncbi:MAG: hypothetical protein ACP5KV_07890 [Candidatus Methanomethylicaceae archaeon]